MNTYIMLHNIRSAHNVGSAFRTADGAGVTKIFLSGYTPAPVDRFGREHKEIVKTSLGATKHIPYEICADASVLISRLKNDGVQVVAVEQTPEAQSYTEFVFREGDRCFLFGNEITGVEDVVLHNTDAHIEIPMLGKKESLNVSVCVGIILFHFR